MADSSYHWDPGCCMGQENRRAQSPHRKSPVSFTVLRYRDFGVEQTGQEGETWFKGIAVTGPRATRYGLLQENFFQRRFPGRRYRKRCRAPERFESAATPA